LSGPDIYFDKDRVVYRTGFAVLTTVDSKYPDMLQTYLWCGILNCCENNVNFNIGAGLITLKSFPCSQIFEVRKAHPLP